MTSNRDIVWQNARPALEVPFALEEYQRRHRTIREAMAKAGVDLLFLSAPESLHYVSGYQCEWYQAQSPRGWPPTSGIALHRDHDRIIQFETPSEAVLVRMSSVAQDIRIFPLAERRDGIGFIRDELKAAGWLTGTVGLELHNYRPNPVVSGQFRAAFEEAGQTVTDGTDLIRRARHVKSPQEMAYLVQAARIAEVGMAAARDTIRPGITELEVWGEMIAAMARVGGEVSGIVPPVASGHRAVCSHPLATRKVILPGEPVNVDLCGVYNRYHCNIARTFYVGEAPRAVVEFHDRVAKVFEVIEGQLRPELPVAELWREVKAYYEAEGLLEHAYWLGGYELGVAFPPDWVGEFVYQLTESDSDAVFAANTVVNHEAIFFGPPISGLTALIETLFFFEDRAEIACRFPREITVV